MERNYKNGVDSNEVRFFVGKELEHTPMYDHMTLFVVGNEFDEEIEKRLKLYPDVDHIYFAANHSYDVFNEYDQLERFLNKGYNVTYECTADMYQYIKDRLPLVRVVPSTQFTVMISVVVPKIDSITHPDAKNSIILKIDDTDTDRTNAGVWCHDIGYMLDNDKFTDFKEYGNDTLLD